MDKLGTLLVKDDVSEFIKDIKKNPELYDSSNGNYSRCDKKLKIWKKLGSKYGLTACACERRWKLLRIRFIKENKKIEDNAEAKILWKHYHSMNFIKKPSNNCLRQNSLSKVSEKRSLHNLDTKNSTTCLNNLIDVENNDSKYYSIPQNCSCKVSEKCCLSNIDTKKSTTSLNSHVDVENNDSEFYNLPQNSLRKISEKHPLHNLDTKNSTTCLNNLVDVENNDSKYYSTPRNCSCKVPEKCSLNNMDTNKSTNSLNNVYDDKSLYNKLYQKTSMKSINSTSYMTISNRNSSENITGTDSQHSNMIQVQHDETEEEIGQKSEHESGEESEVEICVKIFVDSDHHESEMEHEAINVETDLIEDTVTKCDSEEEHDICVSKNKQESSVFINNADKNYANMIVNVINTLPVEIRNQTKFEILTLISKLQFYCMSNSEASFIFNTRYIPNYDLKK